MSLLQGIPIYSEDELFEFTCEKVCWGSCCSNIPITAWDIIVFKEYFKCDTSVFLKEHTMLSIKTCPPMIMLKHHPKNMEWKFGGMKDRCHFLTTKRICSVYEARPIACRNYPMARISYKNIPDEYFQLSCPHIHEVKPEQEPTATAKPAKEFLHGVEKAEKFTMLTEKIPKEQFTKNKGFIQQFLLVFYDWDKIKEKPSFTTKEEEFEWVLANGERLANGVQEH